MTRTKFRPVSIALLVLFALASFVIARPMSASAHPLGNFTINTASHIDLYADAIRITYTVDMAEIPAFQEKGRIDINGDGSLSPSEIDAYLATEAPSLASALSLKAGSRIVEMRLLDTSLVLLPGDGGLETLRIDLLLEAPATAGLLVFEDGNYADRLGWREATVAAGTGVPLASSDVPGVSPTLGLTSYPADAAAPSMRTTSAAFAFTPGIGVMAPEAILAELALEPASTGGFASLLNGRQLTFSVVLLMLIVAMGFGAVHALEPGHGKTIVAAYFVGTNGRAAHAALLGLIVAATHSIGVLVIGAVTLYGTQYILPEDLYPWLTLGSGVMVVGLGIGLLASRLSGNHYLKHLSTGHLIPHRHHHEHEFAVAPKTAPAHVHAAALVPAQSTWGQARWEAPARYGSGGHGHETVHGHSHPHARAAVRQPKESSSPAENVVPWKSLTVLGLVDGLIPTPSTLVVLLSAISVGQFALGLGLVVAFSVGLAIVLSSISLVTIGAKGLLARVNGGAAGTPSRFGAAGARIAAVAPGLAACALITAGSVIIIRASAGTLW